MKHALIVGGSKGLGRELALRFGASGEWRVSVFGRSRPEEAAPNSTCHAVDIADRAARQAALEAAVAAHGPLDTLVFCQRFRGPGDSWAGEIDVTLSATKETLEWAFDHFAPAGWRSVVLVGSVAGPWIAADQPAGYHVAKAGLETLVRYYAVKWGPAGIRVNAVAPSAFIKAESKHYHETHPEVSARMAKLTPLRRMGSAGDAAEAVLFLASERAGFITGQNLVVDGGLTLQLQTSLG
jgi:NAD(P)-dependent dehydrogenase (short-subunit alcohol dehydrogenase family)